MFWNKYKKKEKKMPLFEKAGVKVERQPNLKEKLDKKFSMFIRLEIRCRTDISAVFHVGK